uniref:G domain-containing protein n=1 Tax=Rhizophagus irregularis (strain DAOM 181602 / DAOM 197198 / MUCL 43194) TaxID=747089 RepID=U9T868_RHIID
MRKYVTLFGRTGCGKSSIANMLFTIGHGADGETVRVRSYFTEKYQVFDMVGLGEPSSHLVSHKKAVKTLLLNYIFYVRRKGRITEEDVKMFKLFKETFKGGEKNFIIIITHSKPGWITDNLEIIRKNFGNYPIISVDFPLTDEDEDDIIASDKRKRVLSSTQIIEKKVSEIVSIIPIAGSLYQLIASGVYYKLGKPKHALIGGIIGVTLDVFLKS